MFAHRILSELLVTREGCGFSGFSQGEPFLHSCEGDYSPNGNAEVMNLRIADRSNVDGGKRPRKDHESTS